ncbi:GDP-4-dehydro-6-deoxy-D-mannose reductase [Candidatus Hakubella thermalkaliphila]|uniref:GDP-4-dehydro-6-deoxy-D-mannose reductase n=1 Tax=Candidatus Hakubella thermalkaliphila TaxID=2754717 RepID=A0A6V8NY42_9ACTN|nr:GDP-4-dehydro-6-deoxy-D-mannose reductase [Candidatus Hakubella thermalkaliphila]GFP42237.1 GDP-4-dehydro-6-deoxy-D-mannose reductase [Candidatus Hakubella thermalkaliphila]
MIALVTGASGFVGRHLCQRLLEEGVSQVVGMVYRAKDREGLPRDPRLKVVLADVLDAQAIEELIRSSRPQEIYHLAAQSSAALSWEDPRRTYEINIFGQLNLLGSLLKSQVEASVLITGSGEVYGKVSPEQVPITEDYPLRPDSPYAVSKAAQDLLGYQYYSAYKMRILRTRSFNHTGPGQSPAFVCSDLARQIAQIEAERHRPVIQVGNLEPKRDFTDVRDVVRAYIELIRKGRPEQPYNVCSGRAYAIGEILEMLLAMSEKRIEVEVTQDRFRPSDLPILLGDNRRIREDTGWSPAISIEKSLRDLLDYWRAKGSDS